jgi:hypothetical protein
MIMFGTDNITLKKLNHAGLPKGHNPADAKNRAADLIVLFPIISAIDH